MPRAARPPQSTKALSPRALLRRTLELGRVALYRDPDLYDQLYRRRTRDVRFYVELAKRYGGPVLELGVGSGRVSLAIAKAGIEVVGIELSAPMLAQARAHAQRLQRAAQARITLVKADLRTLALGRRFPLVIAPFNVLMHAFTLRELDAAFESCRRHVARDGRLAFDVLLPNARELAQAPLRSYRAGSFVHPKTGARYACFESSHYDPWTQIRTMHLVLEPAAQRAGQRATQPAGDALVVPLSHRQIFPSELELLLARHGFAVEALYGDFDRSPPSEDSPSQIVIAKRAR